MKTFSERLKYAMTQANLTQRQLAQATGASPAAVSQYLSGKNTPNADRMKVLADATGVSVNFLMGFENAPDQVAVKGLSDVKITFVKACRCLQKSEDSVRKLMVAGCEFGRALPGTGGKLNQPLDPRKPRQSVGPHRLDTPTAVTAPPPGGGEK